MEIKLLNKGYKSDEEFYKAFLSGELLNPDSEYISTEEKIIIDNKEEFPDFPIYMGKGDKEIRRKEFLELIHIMADNFIDIERDIFMDELFWHSYLCIYKRDYLLEKYPVIKDSYKEFKKIVIKKFDWENYIYRAILSAQYVNDFTDKEDNEKYYNLIVDNLDLFNYIIKYEVFRNGQFLINMLSIVDETGTGEMLKKNIKGMDPKDDKRYGRMIVYEFNKSYPIIMAPMLEKNELKEYFFKFLKMYL